MPAFINIPIGTPFGKLVVMALVGSSLTQGVLYLCECDCGRLLNVPSGSLKNGHTRSCGCYKIERTRAALTTHGQSKSLEYKIWNGIVGRCTNIKNRHFHNYGGRGIRICQGLRRFEGFADTVPPRPSRAHSLDRTNNDGNYSCGKCDECVANGWPMNVRWATKEQQQNNTRLTTMITLNGVSRPLSDWARDLGIPKGRIKARIARGWTVLEALTIPRLKPLKLHTYNGKTQNRTSWAREMKIDRATLDFRLESGWTLADALTIPPNGKVWLITYKGQAKPLSAWAREYDIHPKTLEGRIKAGWPVEKALTEPRRPAAAV